MSENNSAALIQPLSGEAPATPEALETPKPDGAEGTPAPAAATHAPDPAKESQRFAALARREKAIQAEKAAIKAERDALNAEKASLKSGLSMDQLKQKFSQNPFEVISELGGSFEQLVDYAGKDSSSVDPVAKLRAEWEAEKKARADQEKAQKAAQQKQHEEALAREITKFKTDIHQHLLTNKDEYELTHVYDAEEVVFAVIEQHYVETSKKGNPRIMTIKEAADMVEKDLLERTQKASKSKKLAPQTTGQQEEKGTPQPTIGKPQGEPKTPTQPPTRTLNNQLIGQSVPASGVSSEKERIARALAALAK